MVEVVQTGTIETTHDVHYIAEYYCFVEGSFFWRVTKRFQFRPFTSFCFIAEEIVEALLLGVDAAEDENCALKCDC